MENEQHHYQPILFFLRELQGDSMLPEEWFYQFLADLAQSIQLENEFTWGMSDALFALIEAAHQQGNLQRISIAEAIAWVNQHMMRLRPALLLAQDTPPERARLDYHKGRVAACAMVLMGLQAMEK